jgi:hypothetical protein
MTVHFRNLVQEPQWKVQTSNSQKKKDKKRSTKHCTDNYRLSNTNPSKNRMWTQVIDKTGPHKTTFVCTFHCGSCTKLRKWTVMFICVNGIDYTLVSTLDYSIWVLKFFTGIRIAQSVVICAMFCRSFFVLFLLAIALSVLLFTSPRYHFGIFFF